MRAGVELTYEEAADLRETIVKQVYSELQKHRRETTRRLLRGIRAVVSNACKLISTKTASGTCGESLKVTTISMMLTQWTIDDVVDGKIAGRLGCRASTPDG